MYLSPFSPIRNSRLAGDVHPVTGVPFGESGYPEFDSLHDVALPKHLLGPDVKDIDQFKYATEDLRDEIFDDPELAEDLDFTPKQLEQIFRGEPKIDGLTWHHHEDGVTLQLVDEEIHALTGHSGGRQATGGRP